MGAFSLVTLLNPFAKSVVIEGISPLDRAINPPQFNLTQYGSGGAKDYLSYSNSNLYQQYIDATTFYPDGGEFNRAFPNVQAPFYGFTGEYNYYGILQMFREQSFTEDALVEYDGARIIKIKFMFVVGFQNLTDYPGSPNITLDHLYLSFNGHIAHDLLIAPGTPKDFVNITTFGADRLVELVVDNQSIPFWYKTYVCEVDLSSFEVFINGTENFTERPDTVDLIGLTPHVYWEGLPQYFVRILTYQPRAILSVVMPSDFGAYEEEIQIGENDKTVNDLENKVDDLINDMHVPTVNDSTIDDILGSVDNSSVEDVAGLVSVFDNDLLSVEMSEFLSLILIASLGIAFTGYALHGKRG